MTGSVQNNEYNELVHNVRWCCFSDSCKVHLCDVIRLVSRWCVCTAASVDGSMKRCGHCGWRLITFGLAVALILVLCKIHSLFPSSFSLVLSLPLCRTHSQCTLPAHKPLIQMSSNKHRVAHTGSTHWRERRLQDGLDGTSRLEKMVRWGWKREEARDGREGCDRAGGGGDTLIMFRQDKKKEGAGDAGCLHKCLRVSVRCM